MQLTSRKQTRPTNLHYEAGLDGKKEKPPRQPAQHDWDERALNKKPQELDQAVNVSRH